MKVVVGKAERSDADDGGADAPRIVNPYWNVPADLAAERIAPQVLKEGMPYFKAKRYQVLSDWGDNPKVIGPTTIDWQAVKDGRKRIRVRQLPGPDNAMGKVKFEFPNPQGIYLHDTNDPACSTMLRGCSAAAACGWKMRSGWPNGCTERPLDHQVEQAGAKDPAGKAGASVHDLFDGGRGKRPAGLSA